MIVLSVNAGSSSLKFRAYNMPEEEVLISGVFERIGIDGGFYTIKVNGEKIKKEKDLPTHEVAVNTLLDELLENKVINSYDEIEAVGHRVVHGGEKYTKSVLINDDVKKTIEELSDLAPLHNPANLVGINTFEKLLPNVKNVAVFDTAFLQTLPPSAYIYPVPYEWYTQYGVRKYGFHGTSHRYINSKIEEIMGRKDLKVISCHLGNGGSLAAIDSGKAIDTSLGFTPNAGLMMGTRSGGIDLNIIPYVMRKSGKSIEEIIEDLNKRSGFLGVSGKSSDSRDISAGIEKGDTGAQVLKLAGKIINLRIFPDENDKMNKSLLDIAGEMLIVSQFTLCGDCKKGTRPSFDKSAPPDIANKLYEAFIKEVSAYGIKTASGCFGAMMEVELINDGPVTFMLEVKNHD